MRWSTDDVAADLAEYDADLARELERDVLGGVDVPLTKGYVAIIDQADVELVSRHTWHASISCGNCVCARTNITVATRKRAHISMHRLIGAAMGFDQSLEVDHIDGDRLNNRRSNLRPATNAQNVKNVGPRKTNRSGYKGVCWHKKSGAWAAQINVGGRRRHLGLFANKESAARVYDAWAREAHAEFARLNFGDEEEESAR